ncbi:unnamed protein product [Symbiodinium natans]|uniref:Uncharacterized protein n=1 Tax=Symbiodinium natans TaxID=878477 RepID=A0A812U458_9DINO|nr:unnamed protein product [Symbiodinium natans]
MRRWKARASELCHGGIFRAASSVGVLSGLGKIFDTESIGDFRSTTPVKDVDVFISHSWSSGRWEKYLAVCYFLNLGLATKAMLASVVLSESFMLVCPNVNIHIVFWFLLDFPILVFFLVFFFGQHLTCGVLGPRFWVDRLCVDQTDETTKAEGIAALPTIVANSSDLLVFWDKSYCERLWCNFELSIFVKSHGLKNLRLAPLWLTPWLLTTMLLSYVSARLVAVFTEFDPGFVVNTVNATSKFQGVDGTPFAFGLHRISEYVLQSQAYVLFCAPPMLVGLFCFQKKLDGHRDMLESMASFDVRNAKCAVEQDRLFIEAQVAELFDGLEDPIIAVPIEVAESVKVEKSSEGDDERQELMDLALTSSARLAVRSVTGFANHEDCLEEFNIYVQGPLRDAVVEDLGDATDIPYAVCLLAMFPWVLALAPVTWVQKPALHALGFRSDLEYFAVSFTENLFVSLVYPAAFPCLFRCVKYLDESFDRGFLRAGVACVCGCLTFSVVQLECSFAAGSLEGFIITQHPAFLGFFVLAVIAAMFQHYMLFCAGWPRQSSREIGM